MDQEQLRLMEMEDEDEAAAAKPSVDPIALNGGEAALQKKAAGALAVNKVVSEAKNSGENAVTEHPPTHFDELKNALHELPEATRGLRAGTAQGASAGFSDEMEGGLNGLAAAANLKINDNNDLTKGVSILNKERPPSWKDVQDAYTNSRNDRRKTVAKAEADQPIGYGVGELGGSMMIPVPGAAEAKGIKALAKSGAKVGSVLGSANYVGHSDEDLGDTLTSPGMIVAPLAGAGVGAAGNVVLGKGAQWLKSVANKKAVQAISPAAGITNRLRNEGLGSPEKIQSFGSDLLKEGIVPWSGNKEEALSRAGQLIGDQGDEIGNYLKDADARTEAAVSKTYNPQEARDAQQRLGMNYDHLASAAETGLPNKNAVAQMAQGPAVKLVDAFRKQGELTPGSYQGAWDAKKAAQKSLNFSDQAPQSQEIARNVEQAARNNIKTQLLNNDLNKEIADEQERALLAGKPYDTSKPEEIQRLLDTAAPKSAERLKGFEENLHRYQVGAHAQELAQEATSRNVLKSTFGLPEIMTGIEAAHVTSSPVTGLAAAGAMGLLKNRGTAPVARGADLASKMLRRGQGPIQDYLDDNENSNGKPLTDWEKFTHGQ